MVPMVVLVAAQRFQAQVELEIHHLLIHLKVTTEEPAV
jgi:hypothetical protein